MYHYSDESRASDAYALPNIETFYRTSSEIAGDDLRDDDGELLEEGWYAWVCFPGYMPDSDASGPYPSEKAALDDMRRMHEGD